MPETRILIADDHAVVRSGLRAVIEAQPGWTVVAEAGDGRDAVAKTLETKPDVAIIDYSLPLAQWRRGHAPDPRSAAERGSADLHHA